MFGHYFRKLDNKSRVIIPAKLKEELGKFFYATIGLDNVLELRDKKSFDIWKEKLLSANTLNANARKFARMLLGRTIEVELDNQNRMSISQEFMIATNLTSEVAFVGVGNKVELWSKANFESFTQEMEQEGTLDDLANKLLKDGVEL